MFRYLVTMVLALATLGAAQKTTEIFIPIGKSPGLSGKYTKMGEIEAVDAQDKTITMADSEGSYTVRIAEDTAIWLDKSQMKATNQVGSFSDLVAGRLVELKFNDNDPEGGVEWIKVRVSE